MLTSTLVLGLVLGGTYAMAALGLTLQYGVARIMNLAYGEFIITASFATYVLFTALNLNPVVAIALVVPAGFLMSYGIYFIVIRPLAARAKDAASLEIDSILATFGMLFLIQGLLLVSFGSNYTNYSYLNTPVEVFGVVIAANRLLAFVLAIFFGGGLYLVMTRTRWGMAMRAVATQPESAALVGLDINKTARLAFALGGALAALAGVVISMHETFTATGGVVFTMKALVVVILGGVGNLLGALVAGLLLGLIEALVSTYIDPGLTLAATYGIFLLMLLWRPTGIFGRAGSR
ncbi:MAG: branched-chain amino acid ABC transporter permease [Rhodospirillales bacterium]|nr:branched-chain amino acid ABC transporter permease [Rhodospirillales bacterium]